MRYYFEHFFIEKLTSAIMEVQMLMEFDEENGCHIVPVECSGCGKWFDMLPGDALMTFACDDDSFCLQCDPKANERDIVGVMFPAWFAV